MHKDALQPPIKEASAQYVLAIELDIPAHKVSKGLLAYCTGVNIPGDASESFAERFRGHNYLSSNQKALYFSGIRAAYERGVGDSLPVSVTGRLESNGKPPSEGFKGNLVTLLFHFDSRPPNEAIKYIEESAQAYGVMQLDASKAAFTVRSVHLLLRQDKGFGPA